METKRVARHSASPFSAASTDGKDAIPAGRRV